jgi:hypothetical protein
MRAVAWMLIHGRSSVMELLSVMNGYFGLSVSILQSSLLTLA